MQVILAIATTLLGQVYKQMLMMRKGINSVKLVLSHKRNYKNLESVQ